MFRESDVLELKESLQLKDEIGKAVSAFANSGKGKILVGITDKGKVIGLQVGRKTLHDLVNFIKENTDPHIYPDVSVKKIRNKNIIEIKVKESSEKPVFFKGRVYKRVGTTSQRVPVSEIRVLLKESEQVFWDGKVCPQAALKDLDLTFVKKFFLPLYEQISKRKITGKAQNVLTHLGCIGRGKPTNAVCHRDYENQHTKVIVRMFDKRIEVDNPGGLPSHITPENILSKQFSRNPTISKVLAKVGYIEDLGEGWNKIIKEHKRHLLKPKPPLIEADNSSTVVTLFSAKDKFVSHEKLGEKVGRKLGEKVGRKLNKNESRIIDGIAKDKYVTIKMLSEELDLSTTAVENNIKKLKNKKLLSRTGSDKGGRWELIE